MNPNKSSIFSRLAMPLVIAAIVVYLICSAWMGVRDPFEFTVAYTDTMETSVETAGWVVRSEVAITGGEGMVQLKREEGEKVGKGQELAVVYQDESYVEKQEELLQTQTDLSALQYATYDQSPSGVILDNQMLTAMTDLRTAASSGNYTGLSEQTETYRKLVLRREFLVSSEATAEMTQAAGQLQARYQELQAGQAQATTVTAPVSGLFSSYVDGYESLLTPDSLVGLSPKDLAAFSQLTPQTDTNCLGKLVTNAAWYYAITVPGEVIGRFSVGGNVDVFFDSLSQTFPMEVDSVGEVQQGQAVVILRSTQNDTQAEDLRQESGRVIFYSSEGIRVPKEALRINDDGERGVYVKYGSLQRFRRIVVLFEDENYLLLDPEAEDNEVRLYDEIIVEGPNLQDGGLV